MNSFSATIGVVTVDWHINLCNATCVNAASAADLASGQPVHGSLVFSAGQSIASITIGIANDTLPEDYEEFTIQLSLPSPIVGGVDSSAALSLVQLAESNFARGLRCYCSYFVIFMEL